jgi:hypothetical protein
MTGTVYTIPPIPPDDANTTYVAAGALRIGVEYRLLNDAELAANYQGEDMEQIQAATQGQTVEDNGVSIHVFGEEDGHEYLRFDMFAKAPHYHYIDRSGEQQTILEYDRVALGDMLPWALQQLRIRLPEMLRFAGGDALADALDPAEVAQSLEEVETLARAAEATLRAQLQG